MKHDSATLMPAFVLAAATVIHSPAFPNAVSFPVYPYNEVADEIFDF